MSQCVKNFVPIKKNLFETYLQYPRSKYFAERASTCDGHFWCALRQNSWFLVGKLQNFDNFMENN